jgi:type IV secretion system protein VirD4
MTPFANASTALKTGIGAAASTLALAVFLFVSSNVLLLGLRLHDGGLHFLAAPQYWWQHSDDERVRRWLTLAGLAGLLAVMLPAGAVLRSRPPALHGRARFATEREINKAGLRAKHGILCGRKDGRYLCFGGPEHVVVYAPTRSGKGVGLVIPNLLNWPDSVVCLDVKRENWLKTAGFRARHGQEVHLFDPFDEEARTARYNPLSYVRRDRVDRFDDLQRIATMLFPAETRGDPFWTEAARTAFIAIGGYIAETPALPLTIGEIYRQMSAASDLKKHFEATLKARSAGENALSKQCRAAMNDFLAVSENTLNSVRKTVTARLGLWQNPRVDLATADSSFDLRMLRVRPISIYLSVTPDNLDRLAPLLNLFFQQVVDLNTRELPEQNPRLTRQLLLLLDEFPALGNVNVLVKGAAFVAGYGLRLLTILQSPAQLRAIYGPDLAKNFMTNHAVEVVFTPKEQEVAAELSERFGYDTVKARSRSGPRGLNARATSETVSEQRRALMLPQELVLVAQTRAFLLKAGLPPVQAEKIVYYEDPNFVPRLVQPPQPRSMFASDGSQVIRLSEEVRELKASLDTLRLSVQTRPVSDDEIVNPSSIPDDAVSINFNDVNLDLTDVPEEALRQFTLSYIDGQIDRGEAA